MVNNNTITTTLVLIVSLALAVVLGSLVVTDQKVALGWVGGAAVVALCLVMGKNIWLLIPFSIYLKLDFPWLPGRFPPSHIAVLLATVMFMMLAAMRRVPIKFRLTPIELIAGLIILCIVQVYLRHPVGLQALGSSSYGARPYFDVAVAILGFMILASVDIEAKKLRTAMAAMLLGGGISIFVKALAMTWPSFGMIAARYVGAFGSSDQLASVAGEQGNTYDKGGAGRNFTFQELATVGSRWVASKLNPLTSLVRPFWLVVVAGICVVGALSGFRNIIAVVALNFVVAAYYWGRFQSVAMMGILAAFGLALIAIINQVAPLPPNVQRSFSFLPGTWEERYVLDAQGSTDWRVEMWKQALFTNRYIDNKFLGDGLGFKASEFQGIQVLQGLSGGSSDGGSGGFDLQREAAMLAGDYHSGPVSFIRTIGYAGLAVYLVGMGVLVVQAHRLIKRARGTEWFGLVCFFCIPVIWWPAFFIFVGGAFNQDMPLFFFHAGFMRLLQNNLPIPVLAAEPSTSRFQAGAVNRAAA